MSRPSLPKIADFLLWLRKSKKLSVSAVLGYRSMLSAVFRTVLHEISTSSVLQDLLRSFKVEAPCRVIRPPAWDLLKVLDYLRSSVFDYWLDTPASKPYTEEFVGLLNANNIKNFVMMPTHVSGHTHDLVLAPTESDFVGGIEISPIDSDIG